MPQDTKNNRILFISGIVAIAVIFIVIIALFIRNLFYDTTVEILVAPSFATVEIDGKKHKSDTTVKLKSGTHSVKISADGFNGEELSLNTAKDETSTIYTYLIPESGSMDWYIDHPSEDMIVTRIGSYLAEQTADEYLKKYPVSSILPIEVVEYNQDQSLSGWVEYRIDGGQFKECKSEFCIKITDTSGGNRDHAIQKIHDQGFNPNDYEIVYEYTPVQEIDQATLDKIYQQYGVSY